MGNCGCDCSVANLKVVFGYLRSDLIKKQRSFKIGLVSIFLVVFFLTILLYGILLSPSIFIKLCEEDVGEIDLIFTPYLATQNAKDVKDNFQKFYIDHNQKESVNLFNLKFLNFYEISKKLEGIDFLAGLTPRWVITGNSTNLKYYEKNFLYSTSTVYIIDSKKENNIGIGRKLKLPDLQENECYISQSLGNALKSKVNDLVSIEIKIDDLLRAYSGADSSSLSSSSDLGFHGSGMFDHDDDNDYWSDQNSENSNNEKEQEENNVFGKSGIIKSVIKDFIKKIISQSALFTDKGLSSLVSKFLPKSFKIGSLENLKINKNFLLSPLFKNIYYIQLFNKYYFEENDKSSGNKLNIVKQIVRQFLHQIIIYDKKTENLEFNKKFLNILKISQNKEESERLLNEFFKENIENMVERFEVPKLTSYLNFRLNLTVGATIKSIGGKWPSASGNVIAFDSNHIKKYLETNLVRIVNEICTDYGIVIFKEAILNYTINLARNFDINKYALTVNGVFKDKFDVYNRELKPMRHYISEKTENIMEKLTLDYPANINVPLYEMLTTVDVVKIFLRNIFIGIMFFLWLLCVFLVYSLMSANVDERTFEFGLLRALGFKKFNLTFVIIFQGFIFAIPGILFGLIAAYIGNNLIAFFLHKYTALAMPYLMNYQLILFAFGLGLSIPLFSSYFPVKKALSENLRETLAIFNKKIGEIVVSIIKLENLGISPTGLLLAITLLVIGFLTYYVAPLSFILLNPGIFIFIMICILITMLLGLILLSQLIIEKLEKLVLKFIMLFTCKDKKLHFIVLKNLEGHKRRNRQISLMFIVALGFVIFAGCTLNLIVDFVGNLSKSLMGGDFFIQLTNIRSKETTIDEVKVSDYLEMTKKNFPNIIQNYAYTSFAYSYIFGERPRIGTLAGYPISKRTLIGVDKNFVDSIYNEYYMISEYDKTLNVSKTNDKIDLIKMLSENPNTPPLLKEINDGLLFPYFKSNNTKKEDSNELESIQLNLLAAEGIKKTSVLGVDNPGKVCTEVRTIYEECIPGKVVGLAKKIPGMVLYSSYQTIALLSEVLISMEQMRELILRQLEKIKRRMDPAKYEEEKINILNRLVPESVRKKTKDWVRKERVIVKYKEGTTLDERNMVYYSIKNFMGKEPLLTTQMDDVIETSQNVKKIFGYIFLILGIIALILSFFLIWTAFYSNIRENIAEYGIMRSIGVTKKQSTRIYLYEAASIIISSIIIGTIIGVVISSTLILQFDIFVELPFVFNFPIALYFILILVGLGLGLLGSYYPTYAVNSLSLVKIMKGFSE